MAGSEWNLHVAESVDILTALLDSGGNPTLITQLGQSALMYQASSTRVANVARLLQDPRVRATLEWRTPTGNTALHTACIHSNEVSTTALVRPLLQAGADYTSRITDTDGYDDGLTPLAFLRKKYPTHHTTIALLEQAPIAAIDAEKVSLLVKARRLVVATSTNTAATPSYLQARVARGQPLPRLELVPVGRKRKANIHRKFSTMLAFLLGIAGGPKNEGMPRDVFRVVMTFVMPVLDPLRWGVVGEHLK